MMLDYLAKVASISIIIIILAASNCQIKKLFFSLSPKTRRNFSRTPINRVTIFLPPFLPGGGLYYYGASLNVSSALWVNVSYATFQILC